MNFTEKQWHPSNQWGNMGDKVVQDGKPSIWPNLVLWGNMRHPQTSSSIRAPVHDWTSPQTRYGPLHAWLSGTITREGCDQRCSLTKVFVISWRSQQTNAKRDGSSGQSKRKRARSENQPCNGPSNLWPLPKPIVTQLNLNGNIRATNRTPSDSQLNPILIRTSMTKENENIFRLEVKREFAAPPPQPF